MKLVLFLAIAVLLQACQRYERDGFRGSNSESAECVDLRVKAQSEWNKVNTCTRHEDCVLVPGLGCRNDGVNKNMNSQAFELAVRDFTEASCGPDKCLMNLTTSTAPCQNGRCVNEVDQLYYPE